MPLSSTSVAVLQLEETLLILEESLAQPSLSHTNNKKHISRLKQFYSPLFDFEHSESGSYYYATLQCVKATYIDDNAIYKLPLSTLFIDSILCLLEINTLSLDTKRNSRGITEALLNLARLWNLHHQQDMADLISNVIACLRRDIIDQLNTEITKTDE